MGYITVMGIFVLFYFIMFQSSFELMGYITASSPSCNTNLSVAFQSSFELMGYITISWYFGDYIIICFKALSSLWVI